MRPLLICVLITTSCWCQQEKGSVGLQFGYDLYQVNEDGWNIGGIGRFNFRNSSKWYHEYLINYSEIEYNTGEDRLQVEDNATEPVSNYPGDWRTNLIYRKQNVFRIKAGIGTVLWNKGDRRITAGWDLATSFLLKERGNGESIFFLYEDHYDGENYTSVYAGEKIVTYSFHNHTAKRNYLLEFIPNISYEAKLYDHLWLNIRGSFFMPVISEYHQRMHGQLNMGIHYQF